jgi:hypothetical protein
MRQYIQSKGLIMNISSIGSLNSIFQSQSATGIGQSSKKDRDGDHDGSSVSGNGGGGAFLQNVLQTLQSMGINLPVTAKTDATGVGTSSDQSANDQTSGIKSLSPDVRKALHTFMHDLRHALKQESSSAVANSSSPANGYNQFSADLQNLIGSLNNPSATGSTGSSNPVGGALKTDFSNLLQALGGNAQASTGNTPSLKDFLGQLESKLGGQDGSPGSLINTTA